MLRIVFHIKQARQYLYKVRNAVARSLNNFCSGKATVFSMYTAGLHVTVKNIKIRSFSQKILLWGTYIAETIKYTNIFA
jgi:hypothetical protein